MRSEFSGSAQGIHSLDGSLRPTLCILVYGLHLISRLFKKGERFPILLGIIGGLILHDLWNHDEEQDARIERMKANGEILKRKEALRRSGVEGDIHSAKPNGHKNIQDSAEEGDFELPEELPEDAVFLPLTFPREIPPSFYKGSDEAWQSFVALSHDKPKIKELRNTLAGIVGQNLSQLREIQKFLGTDIRPRRYWLDLAFPDGPPPEYERIGLEITDDYVALTTRPIDAYHVAQIKHTLWPKPIAVSLWRGYEALWSAQLNSIKQYLNLPTAPMAYDVDAEGGEIYIDDLDEASSDTEDIPRGPASVKGTSRPLPPGHPPIPDKQSEEGPEQISLLQKMIFEPGRVSFEVFKHQMAKNWEPPSAPLMVYGSVMFSGLVELVGPKGFCVCDVSASYHPIEAKWVTISVGLRRVQSFKQPPKGDRSRLRKKE